jgi:hypothetical protein
VKSRTDINNNAELQIGRNAIQLLRDGAELLGDLGLVLDLHGHPLCARKPRRDRGWHHVGSNQRLRLLERGVKQLQMRGTLRGLGALGQHIGRRAEHANALAHCCRAQRRAAEQAQ